ncbi:hypothetical protein Tco_0252926 [Tanacetum coccineum]
MSTLTFSNTHNMVAFLEKPAKSDRFHEIIDFLNANQFHYALTINPTIYTPCIEQFWATAKVKTVNGERQIQALVDKKKVIITESSIRSDLHLEDADGTDYLPTATIFEELARMGYEKPSQKHTFYKAFFSPQWKLLIHTILKCLSAKSTSWNEFSSTMASAIICLATNQKFNLSKYIFDAMVKHLEGGVKFLMYLRFVQVFINQQLGDMSHHKKIYVNPSHTKNIFANMKKEGKDFSKRIPITTQPSTSKPQKKQSRRKQKKNTEVPHPSDSLLMYQMKNMYLLIPMIHCSVLKVREESRVQNSQLQEIVQGCVTRRVKSSDDESLGAQEDASKQGRSRIEAINIDAEVTLVKTQRRNDVNDDNLMFDTGVFDGDKIVVETEEPVINAATTTKSISISTDEIDLAQEITLAQALAAMKSAKPKEKDVV